LQSRWSAISTAPQARNGLHTHLFRHAKADQQYDEYEQYAAWVGNVGPFFWHYNLGFIEKVVEWLK